MRRLRAYLAVPSVRSGAWFLVTSLGLIVLAERLYWQPARLSHSTVRERVVMLQAQRNQLQMRVDAMPTFTQAVAAISNLEARLAAPIDRSAVVERLAEVSSASGTRIIHGANSFGRQRGAVRPVLQDLTIEGRYAQVLDFLQGLAELDTLTLVRSAEFSTNADGSSVRLQLELITLSAGSQS